MALAHAVIERRALDGERVEVEAERADPYGCELEDFARACAAERSTRVRARGRGRPRRA